jgi:purine-nucleoside/S-methyl-5'-thioadenosine phosphorylase / adenosine deaminase
VAVECWSAATATGLVRAVVTDRTDGDFHLADFEPATMESRRRAVVDRPWTMLAERHGTTVVAVDRPGAGDRRPGDVAVTDVAGSVLGVWVGDCAPVILVTQGGTLTAAHAGWRGLAAGVLDVAVDTVADHPGAPAPRGTVAYVGPCIGVCCYEFGECDAAAVACGVGAVVDEITGRTLDGRLGLDVVRAIELALRGRGVRVEAAHRCTGCDPALFSHRVRGERGRHVLAAWKDDGGAGVTSGCAIGATQ